MISKFTARYPAMAKWAELLGLTGGGQIIIQATGFVCGILIVRLLTQEQYAYYTLVNAMLGTMVVLADGGISTGVSAIGGEVWQDRFKFGQAIVTGLKMRREFAIYSLLVSMPILYYLLMRQGLSSINSIFLMVAVVPTFWFSLSGSLIQVVPRLHQEIKALLRIPLHANLLRLFLTGGALAFFPIAAFAILGTGLSQMYANRELFKLTELHADLSAAESPEFRKRINQVVLKVLPGSIYYCLSSQITVWLISIFGGTEGIAEVGALGRLMALLVIIKNTLDTLIVPRFTRLPANDRSTLVTRFFQVLALVALIAGLIVLCIYLFPNLILFVLGDKYSDLQSELVLMAAGSCLLMVGETAGRMTTSRGIIPSPLYLVPFMIISQLFFLLYTVDYSTVEGVLTFSIYSSLSMIFLRIIHFLFVQYYSTES